MLLLLISFLAGVLTVLAPCILPFLPVIVGGGIAGRTTKPTLARPLIITASLAVSVVVFTLLLKATTALLGVPQITWQVISGVIVTLLGLNFLFPEVWERMTARLAQRSNQRLFRASSGRGTGSAILTGAALGPVFTSCSLTYSLIVAAVLPASFATGLAYLSAYALGLSAMLLVVIVLGQKLLHKLGWALDPHGWFHKLIGVLFIVVGVSVVIGLDKTAQSWLLERGFYDGSTQLEQSFERAL